MKRILLASLIAFNASGAFAADKWIAAAGDDTKDCLSLANSCKTWARVDGLLAPGDTLWVGGTVTAVDGTYTLANNGQAKFTCPTNAANGTALAPITIKAINRAIPLITSDGSVPALHLTGCSYYVVDGLRIENADKTTWTNGTVAQITNSPHFTIRHSVLRFPNRCYNFHSLEMNNSDYALIEQNDFYEAHRLALFMYYSDFSEIRLNFGDSVNYPDLACYSSGYGSIGDDFAINYPAHDNLMESNIANDWQNGFDAQATSNVQYDRYLGNLVSNTAVAFIISARGTDIAHMPLDDSFHNNVVIMPNASPGIAFYLRGAKGSVLGHNSVFSLGGANTTAYLADNNSVGLTGDGDTSTTITDSVAVDLGASLRGMFVLDPALAGCTPDPCTVSWHFDHVWATGYTTNFTPSGSTGNGTLTNSHTTDPGFGDCRVWMPAGAAAKGQASDGTDPGARILYSYLGGSQTTDKMWDSVTGAPLLVGCQCTVPGVTDRVGHRLADVAANFNINTAGCPFPTEYQATPTATPTGTIPPTATPTPTVTPVKPPCDDENILVRGDGRVEKWRFGTDCKGHVFKAPTPN